MIGHDVKNMMLMTAVVHDAVCKGCCVILHDNQIVYAGPIKGSPQIDESCILLHQEDKARLMAFMEMNNEKPS